MAKDSYVIFKTRSSIHNISIMSYVKEPQIQSWYEIT